MPTRKTVFRIFEPFLQDCHMDFLQLDHPAEGVARLTIHRPEVRNALNQAVR